MKKLPEKIWTPERATGQAVLRARELRKAMTHAEELLWRELRARRFKDHKFRRQHPIGKWIVDFFSFKSRLAIELDGSVHDGREEDDAWRQGLIESHNVRFLRFKNEDVETDLAKVLDAIAQAIEVSPFSQREKGRG